MKTILKLAFVAGILASASPSFGQLYIGLGVRVGPPPPPREVVAARTAASRLGMGSRSL